MKYLLSILTTLLLLTMTTKTWSAQYAVDCYDRLLLSTMLKSDDFPDGRIMSVDERFTHRNLSLFVDTDESAMLSLVSSKGIRQIMEEQIKPDYRISPIVVSEEIISAHNRTSPKSAPGEFQILTLNLRERTLIKTVVMYGETYTKHYDCNVL